MTTLGSGAHRFYMWFFSLFVVHICFHNVFLQYARFCRSCYSDTSPDALPWFTIVPNCVHSFNNEWLQNKYLLSETAPNRDPKMEVCTEPWIFCAVKPLLKRPGPRFLWLFIEEKDHNALKRLPIPHIYDQRRMCPLIIGSLVMSYFYTRHYLCHPREALKSLPDRSLSSLVRRRDNNITQNGPSHGPQGLPELPLHQMRPWATSV